MLRTQSARLTQPVLLETVLLAAICFADMIWTIIVVQLGIARETNPILAPALAMGPPSFALVKMMSFLVPLAGLEMLRPLRPRLISMSLRVALLGYVALYGLGSLHVHGVL